MTPRVLGRCPNQITCEKYIFAGEVADCCVGAYKVATNLRSEKIHGARTRKLPSELNVAANPGSIRIEGATFGGERCFRAVEVAADLRSEEANLAARSEAFSQKYASGDVGSVCAECLALDG